MKTIAAPTSLTGSSSKRDAQTMDTPGSSPEANEMHFSDSRMEQTIPQSAYVPDANNLAETSVASVHQKDNCPEDVCSDWDWEMEYLLFLSIFLEENAYERER
jgi:hypothetical protein